MRTPEAQSVVCLLQKPKTWHIFSGSRMCGMFSPEAQKRGMFSPDAKSVVCFLQKPKMWCVFSRSQKRGMFSPEAWYVFFRSQKRGVFSPEAKKVACFLQKPQSVVCHPIYSIPYTPTHIPHPIYPKRNIGFSRHLEKPGTQPPPFLNYVCNKYRLNEEK